MRDSKKEQPVPDPKRVKEQVNKAIAHSSALHREVQALLDFYKAKQAR